MILVSCHINNIPCVIPSEVKESRFEIATPACHNTALRCAGTSLKLLAMTMYRSVREIILEMIREKLAKNYFRKFKSPSSWILVKEYMSDW
jgi:hypothetical protein